MSLRGIFIDNFAGDLEYHPRRAFVYFVLALAAFSFWYFSPPRLQFTTVPLVFALGGLSLLLKGIFLVRRSSEGIGMSEQDLANLSQQPKKLPSLLQQASQVIQDAGAGSLLGWPLLRFGENIDKSWGDRQSFVYSSLAQLSSLLDGLFAASFHLDKTLLI